MPISKTTKTPRTPTCSKFAIDAGVVMTKLTDVGYYLGHGDIATKVAFVAGGRMGDRLVAHDAINEAQPEEVRLTLVGEISHDGAWLSAEGAYRPASKLNPGDKITNAKAKFELLPASNPKLSLFRQDWDKYVSNIRSIHKAALKDKGHRSERKEPVQSTPSRLTIRHALLIERMETDDMTESSREEDDLCKLDKAKMMQISFEGWPVSDAWREELDAVKGTHDVNLLPAYDIDHTMILPKDYECCLLGATVKFISP
ncbi:hypothetical protein JB92DRAFT_2860683 [Gautieria morchelliformis]|nr:hypothetical protein JB92DRAFT_2860683 [Gautieria morchelliformis]